MIAGGPGTWQRRLFRPSCLEEKPAETRKRPVLTAEIVTNTTAFILQRDKQTDGVTLSFVPIVPIFKPVTRLRSCVFDRPSFYFWYNDIIK